MPIVSFSLTEKAIIDPILTLRAPLPPLEPGQVQSWKATVWQGIQSELVARVFAAFTSVFAAFDVFVHFFTGMYKGTCLLARKICCLNCLSYSKLEVYAHFRQATGFAGLTVVGSIAGVVWPGIFKSCRYSHPSPSNNLLDAPAHIKKLAEEVKRDQQLSFNKLKQAWTQSSLEDKHWFVQVFNQEGIEIFRSVRVQLADTVYQPIQHLRNRQVKWLNAEEVDRRVNCAWQQASVYNHPFFFHATSEPALESILKSKKVEVRHEKAFRGAFVSTTPETGFGRCILAFKRNIERLSPLEHGFQISQNTYWAGFSRDIPVTESTLAYIILDGESYQELQDLEAHCQQWAGRPIKVISLQDAKKHLVSIQGLEMGIPAEWTSEDDTRLGETILNTLRARAAIAVQNIAQPLLVMAQYNARRQSERQPLMIAAACS